VVLGPKGGRINFRWRHLVILGIYGQLLGHGGIQRVSRHSAAVLASYASEKGMEFHALGLNDPWGSNTFKVGDTQIQFLGYKRRKVRFIASILRMAAKTDIAYITSPYLAPISILLRFIRPSVRCLVASHGVEVWKPLSIHRRLGLRFSQKVTAPSRFTKEKVIEMQNVNPNKIKVIPWGLEPGFSKKPSPGSRPAVDVPPGKLLLTVARLGEADRRKGVEIVIKALPTILNAVPDAFYMVLGDGDDRQRLEDLTNNLGVADHVLFLGQKSDEEIAIFYAACDVFVMPSSKEGFGLVFIEAMAYCKPIIAARHGGALDIVNHEVTGLLTEPGDVHGLASQVIRLLTDSDLCGRMGKAGRTRVEEQFSFQNFRNNLVRVLG